MAIGLGPGKGKKKQASKPLKVYSKDGQMVAAPGYKIGVIPKKGEAPTKKIKGPFGSEATVMNGIYGPVPAGPGGKAAAAPAKKKGPSVAKKVVKKVGQAVTDVKNAVDLAKRRRFATSAYRGGGGLGIGRALKRVGETCAAYAGYPARRRR
jgi:hypothetical protein